jgi:ABC-2 type transport system permease protein
VITTMPAPASPIRAFTIVCRWRFLQLGKELPQLLVAQVLIATGTGVGLGFLISGDDARAGSYIATGAFLLNLFIIAAVMLPNVMAEAKLTGALDYMFSLPAPRIVHPLAELVVWSTAAVPGMLVSLLAMSLRFDLHLHVGALLVPAVLLTVLTATTVGAAIGLRARSQQATNLLTNALLMLVLLFSPVNFPGERLPGWLQAIHEVLPIASMADLVRGGLLAGYHADAVHDLLVLGAWCVVGLAVTIRSVNRTA